MTRVNVWFSLFGWADNGLQYPYEAQSPTTREVIEWNETEVWEEIERIVSEKTKYSIGQNLFYQIPLFANPIMFLDSECQEMIKDYHYCKDYNIPIARSIDEADANIL